ncbi:kelch-like protein 2 isoform X2 [Cryptotermes secundus]|uniref:kelch-like protein 2 isoform X2 n=1 Tax=Cryptotermes secundus TaxID=105785 RepID=UPI001454D2EA|nr:kelch-like protein 2 isoform X2 [Cryptotermes secundus]
MNCKNRRRGRMSAPYKFHDGLHPTCTLQTHFELQKTESFCDVTIVVNEDEIRAHKLVLASVSPYFRAMFTSGFIETTQDRIVMHEMEFSALRDIIDFFYTGKIEVTEENVYLIMEIAELLQVSAIRMACSIYLLSTLNTSNCFSAYVHATLCSYSDIAHKAFRYILHNFKSVMEEEEFLHVPPETLLNVLSSMVLDVSNEHQLLKAVVQWCEHDCSQRFHYLKPLVSKINLQEVPLDLLYSSIQEPLLAPQIREALSQILEEEEKEKRRTPYMYELFPVKSQLRTRHNEHEVMLAIGGETYRSFCCRTCECLTLGYCSWEFTVPEALYFTGPHQKNQDIPPMSYGHICAAVTARDYEVFVIGGTGRSTVLDDVECYSIKSNTWRDLEPLPMAVQGAGAAFLDLKLYVVGGRGRIGYENKVWVYKEHKNEWHEAPPLNTCRGYHGVVAVCGAVYAIGGACGEGNRTDTYLKCMEKYDQGRSRWYTLAPMHETRASFGCVAVGKFSMSWEDMMAHLS